MLCSNCGQEIIEGAAFCTNCGTAVSAAEAVEETVEQTVEAEAVDSPVEAEEDAEQLAAYERALAKTNAASLEEVQNESESLEWFADELDAIRPSQQSSLKQTLSVSKVNSRPIFGRTQEDRPRFASFVATTNNRHPLKDVTGTRRYICILIPDGLLINNTGDINYGQLYAQVMYELLEQKAHYWFNNDEVARIQQLNQNFMEKKDLAEMFCACFRQPREGEAVRTMNCDEMISIIQKDYPTLENTIGNRVRLGKAIAAMGFERKEHSHVTYYKVMPLRAA